MRNLFRSLGVAFSMYTKLPVPMVEWNSKSLAFTMGFFPLTGVIEGLFFFLLWMALNRLGASQILVGAALAVLPALYTGGIHLDGFCDTTDALSSHQSKERKLEILRDSRSGAFAVIYCGVLFLLRFGSYSQLSFSTPKIIGGLCCGFVLSRTLSATSMLTFPKAREGLAQTFAGNASKHISLIMAWCFGLGALTTCALLDWRLALLFVAAAAGVFWYYHTVAMKEFGGITGDLAGWFLEICETVLALAAAVFALIGDKL